QIADDAAVRASSDAGAARDLLAAAAPELARALATDMSGRRGAVVKGDNPVRRVVAAIARALGMTEPALYLSRTEPGVVAPVAADPGPDWDALALGIRESAERVALAICGDPAPAISIVCSEVQGGLERPEVARLARFAVSEAYLAIRAK